MKKPKIFIGSSSEGKDIADNIQLLLDKKNEVTTWSQGIFSLSKGYLEELVKATNKFDFAILVLTPDDMTESRDSEQPAPRDNVIFELGLFIGSLGRERTFIVHDKAKEIKIPSDLSGISMATFRMHSDDNISASLGACCTRIQKEITKRGIIERKSESGEIKVPNFKHDYYNSFLGRLINDFTVIDAIEHPLFSEYVQIGCSNFASSAHTWAKSKLMIPQASYDGFLIDAYENAENAVFSTSIKKYLTIWNEPFGEQLLEAHERSNADVTRVFVFDVREDISNEFVAIMKAQEAAGIDVKIFIDSEYPAFNFPPDLSKDFTVIDNGKIIGKTVTFGDSRNAEWLFDNVAESNKFKSYVSKLTKGSLSLSRLKL